MKLVSDPNYLFFAGDTAQAVARGSLFRFADLSSLVYRNEQQHPHVTAGFRKPVQPQLFQLTTNYRSHNGILQLSAHVIQLLHHFFPSTIDKLEKERGIVDVCEGSLQTSGYNIELTEFINGQTINLIDTVVYI